MKCGLYEADQDTGNLTLSIVFHCDSIHKNISFYLVMVPTNMNIDSRAVMYNGRLTVLVKCGNDKKGVY